MAGITVRKLDDDMKRRLRERAAKNNRSMSQEVREILKRALSEDAAPPSGIAELARRVNGELESGNPSTEPAEEPPKDLYAFIRAIVEPLGGVELDIPPRIPTREPPNFNHPDYDDYP